LAACCSDCVDLHLRLLLRQQHLPLWSKVDEPEDDPHHEPNYTQHYDPQQADLEEHPNLISPWPCSSLKQPAR